MAKEMLDTIRRAEAEALNRQKMAQNSATAAINRAKADAEQAVKDAVIKAEAQSSQTQQQTQEQCAVRSAQNDELTKAECDKLTATAEGNRERVISMVIDTITSK